MNVLKVSHSVLLMFFRASKLFWNWGCTEWESFTCEKFLLDLVGVQDRCGDAGHGANHAAQSEVDEHEEEHDRPEWRRREMGHSFCEGDES